MIHAGRAWRGWFPVGGELTSGRPDRKEGIYFGAEHPDDHPRVIAGAALHGPNLAPRTAGRSRAARRQVARRDGARGERGRRGPRARTGSPPRLVRREPDRRSDRAVPHLPLPADRNADADPDDWGVAEHTDYGLLTVLAQDHLGGLEVARRDGGWIDVEPVPGMFVCNLGDMLERLTNGRYRSTPHRVRNTVGDGPAVVPLLLRPVVGCHGARPADRRRTAGGRTAPLGRRRRHGVGRAPTATTSRPRSPRSSPNCSPEPDVNPRL